MIDFNEQVAVVTGAGRGLGRLYALELAKRGALVVVNDLGGSMHGDGEDTAVADAVVNEIDDAGGEAVASYHSVDSPEGGEAIIGSGGYLGRNLDALADCLRGGFGTPARGPFEFEWQHSDLSRRYLNEVGHGNQTLFEAIQGVFSDAGVPLHLR
jgi:NAD(P)-dependent dehydrogenase (short-subunit alcohol dehydrogenase family)